MIDNWKKMKVKETEEILMVNKDGKKRFIEGEEFVEVKRNEYEKETHYMKRSALMDWR